MTPAQSFLGFEQSTQDAELAACQRIQRGTQAMTIYKPLARLADRAAVMGHKDAAALKGELASAPDR